MVAQLVDGTWIVSPQDMVAEFECTHKVALNAAVSSGSLEMVESADLGLELLRDQGLAHEQARLAELISQSEVLQLQVPARSPQAYQQAWQEVVSAMDAEVEAIYQATLYMGDFLGFADFLILGRDEHGAILRDLEGTAIYEPVDTKSARVAKRGAVLQVAAYAEALSRLGRPSPRSVHLWLAGEDDWSASAEPLIALARRLRIRVTERLPDLGAVPIPDWAAPREACARCKFAEFCDSGRHRDRDVSMIQGIRSITRTHLVEAGLTTIDAVAASQPADRPTLISIDTFENLRAQSALQVEGERQGKILHEVTEPRVLIGLPARSPGDIWFDMEGDPYAPGPAGLEYMFGFAFMRDSEFMFETFEAHDTVTEKIAFEAFIDEVMRRWEKHPEMHVYHYADYERRTLQRLAQQHGTRELEVDRILRAGVLIDLYSIVRQSMRFSTESLSLKYIEGAYGVSHGGEEVSTAMDSVIQYERVVGLRALGFEQEAGVIMDQIRSYNKLDCESTMKLDHWLRALITAESSGSTEFIEINAETAVDLEQEFAVTDPHQEILEALLNDLPTDPHDRTDNEQARALHAAALSFHQREVRPAWWQLFELIKAEPEDLQRASNVLIADRVETDGWGKPPRARKMRRDLTLVSDFDDPRGILDPGSDAFLLYERAPDGMASPSDSTRGYHRASVSAVSETSAQVTERAGVGETIWLETPIAVLPGPPFNTDSIRGAIADAARSIQPTTLIKEWVFPEAAWADLLLARPPRTLMGTLPSTRDTVDDLCKALKESADSYIAVQGPPGTGKTFVGSRTVARLANEGWRIGVVAQSHAVVDNFLQAVNQADPTVSIGKEPSAGKPNSEPWCITGKLDAWALAQTGGYIIGGTAWTLARSSVQALALDLLVIDEAGQFALANAVASARAARTVLLLGDPQQLPQVSQATHPEAMEKSVLEHIIGLHATIPTDRGYFLDVTYRMHPRLTRAVSDLQYEGLLHAAPVTRMRHLDGVQPGVTAVPVPHTENTTSSPEEAAVVLDLVRQLIGITWVGARNDQAENPRPLTTRDIIIVAAYNAQVRLIRRILTDAGFDEIQVGTVDKFQGREEVVVIVSMATSSASDLPRGIEFLLSPNRLNVAISRAQWACLLVHSPALLDASPSSISGMQRLGGFVQLIDSSELK
jgi:uncharacterized protein